MCPRRSQLLPQNPLPRHPLYPLLRRPRLQHPHSPFAAWSCRRPARVLSTRRLSLSLPQHHPLLPPAHSRPRLVCCSAAAPSSIVVLPVPPVALATSSAPVNSPVSSSIPAVHVRSILHAPFLAVLLDPVVLVAAPASASVRDSALHVQVAALADLAPAALVPPVAHRLLARLRVRSVLRPRAVAVAASSTPRPRKAR